MRRAEVGNLEDVLTMLSFHLNDLMKIDEDLENTVDAVLEFDAENLYRENLTGKTRDAIKNARLTMSALISEVKTVIQSKE